MTPTIDYSHLILHCDTLSPEEILALASTYQTLAQEAEQQANASQSWTLFARSMALFACAEQLLDWVYLS